MGIGIESQSHISSSQRVSHMLSRSQASHNIHSQSHLPQLYFKSASAFCKISLSFYDFPWLFNHLEFRNKAVWKAVYSVHFLHPESIWLTWEPHMAARACWPQLPVSLSSSLSQNDYLTLVTLKLSFVVTHTS